jgi:hypothetical protein
MTTLETNQAEPNLNTELTQDELFAKMTAAIEAGDDDEVNRLMGLQTTAQDPETSDESGDDDQADTNSAEPEPHITDSDVNTATPDPATAGSPPDPLAELQAIKAEMHQIKSEAGRVSHLQRELAKATRELEKLKAAQAASEPKPPRKSETLVNNLREVDPVTADALAAVLEEIDERSAATAPQTAQVDEEVEREYQRVLNVHHDAPQIFSGPLRPHWDQFKSLLNPEQLAYAESDKAEEVVLALAVFKRWMSEVYQAQQQSPMDQATQNVAPSQPAQPTTSGIVESRARKLSGQAPTRNTTIKPVDGLPDTKKLHEEVYNQTLRELGIQT